MSGTVRLSMCIALTTAACIGRRQAPPDAHDLEAEQQHPGSDAPIWSGAWSSQSCGTRPYERRLVIDSMGTLSGEERISPCPVGATCAWSGVVTWTGSWSATPTDLTLTLASPMDPRVTTPPTPTLAWRDGQIVELAGAEVCPYRRRTPAEE